MSDLDPGLDRLELRLRAATLEALFVEAAREMVALTGGRAKPEVLIRRPMEVRGEDYATLLLAWLRAILAYSDLEDRVFVDFTIVNLSPLRLTALAAGGLRERLQRRLTLEQGLEIVIRETAEGFETTIPLRAA
ncbi:MAG: archease [Anaerolineales bacterium]|nr:archease [Anaerolineales bacterium]